MVSVKRLLVLLALGTAWNAVGQDMHEAVQTGFRTGGTSGLAIKYFYAEDKVISGVLGTFGNGASITILSEKYNPIYYVKGLFVYGGLGPHLALYNGDNRFNRYYRFLGRETWRSRHELGFGINGIFGAEYRMSKVPLVFSADFKPFIEYSSRGRVSAIPDPSIGIRYVIR